MLLDIDKFADGIKSIAEENKMLKESAGAEWILCSKRLPKEYAQYLVCLKSGECYVYWLIRQMESYCCGYNEVEYNGKWYYTVHHA